MTKVTDAAELAALEEFRAKRAAERSVETAKDMRDRLQAQLPRLFARLESHSHVKVVGVSIDCANGYKATVKLEGEE